MGPEPSELRRAFLCIPMPEEMRDRLADVSRRLRSLGHGLSIPDPAHAHLTLVFLGAIDPAAAAAIRDAMDRAGREIHPFRLGWTCAGTFGSRRSPRVLWLGVAALPALSRLQSQLVDAANHAGIPLEDRPFRPHLTLARVRAPLPPGSLTSMVSCINNTHFAEIMVDRVLFMNSRLNGPGPRFTIIHQAHVKGS